MTILPAIDLLEGACVRLQQGEYGTARRYDEDPVRSAVAFAAAGARWLHLVDLDAARGRGAHNRAVIRRIRAAVDWGLEVGGGIRSEQDLAELSETGADRLILGTVLARDPGRVAGWVRQAAGRGAAGAAGGRRGPELWAGIDAREGRVRVAGWAEEAALEDVELARRARELGLEGSVYTSIARDGPLAGPDLERTNRVAEAAGLPVILSGGIGCAEDVERVQRGKTAGVGGVIVGKALYEGRVDLADLCRRYG